MEPTKIIIYPNSRELAKGATNLFFETAESALHQRGSFHVVLSGGSTPVSMYRQMINDARVGELPWQSIHIYWGDERCVPPDSSESNFGVAWDEFINHTPIPAGNIHRMKGEVEPDLAAQQYQLELQSIFPAQPEFDLIYLGIGGDGHTASLFPGIVYSEDPDIWVQSIYVDKMSMHRITLTPQAINQAKTVVFLVSGARKAEIAFEILNDPDHRTRYPSQLISPVKGILLWYTDADAASLFG